ncbi:hypothetical protein PR001_g14687 [Phytophthora rubi]|uniref:Uncharacterized protein n=1 Tax=Phytophthora rubi TaxID=129364 RepID=A0A6A3LD77_9STRA|nr:hypothetical protein PR001_g14687 [Phytophthora rubi]
MTQVAPSTAPNDVTVVIYTPKTDNSAQPLDRSSTDKTLSKHKVILAIVYTLLAVALAYGLVAAAAFFGNWFTLLLVLTRSGVVTRS